MLWPASYLLPRARAFHVKPTPFPTQHPPGAQWSCAPGTSLGPTPRCAGTAPRTTFQRAAGGRVRRARSPAPGPAAAVPGPDLRDVEARFHVEQTGDPSRIGTHGRAVHQGAVVTGPHETQPGRVTVGAKSLPTDIIPTARQDTRRHRWRSRGHQRRAHSRPSTTSTLAVPTWPQVHVARPRRRRTTGLRGLAAAAGPHPRGAPPLGKWPAGAPRTYVLNTAPANAPSSGCRRRGPARGPLAARPTETASVTPAAAINAEREALTGGPPPVPSTRVAARPPLRPHGQLTVPRLDRQPSAEGHGTGGRLR